ncbi:ParA family protein [Salipaludibacillus agaradhaerens]|jgi:chromosome partitioning protein|uniref:ParA family protein n=1 Tax=Salipaludibacillus agaradhaerens TaxID=76935 RepID=UPI00215101CA|nr:ParA family protein [Salipaludibacillus agaradhaerens]MCR6108658.1 ParA family protein [Salipaludibacillus agaradhaerens]MCR6120682.1 ParA family protein [Salipaludibacillus agaradhaerens]
MTKVITFAIQKGGVGKTMTSGVTAFILAKQGYKVLAVDMDSQGNLTQFLSGSDNLLDFENETVLEAIKEGDARKYIKVLDDNLHLLPTDDYLATIAHYLFTEHKGHRSLALKDCLESVRDFYDFIIIDTPPALSEQTINSLGVSTHVVVMFETSKFCYNAVPRFLDTVQAAKEKINPELEIAGILRTLADSKRSDSKAMADLIEDDYPELVFKTIIHRRATTGRLPIYGLWENPESKKAFEYHSKFIEELIERVSR